MPKYKIEFNRDECIGCGACAAVCDNWTMEGDKAKPKKVNLEEIGCNKDAEETCPVQAIKVVPSK